MLVTFSEAQGQMIERRFTNCDEGSQRVSVKPKYRDSLGIASWAVDVLQLEEFLQRSLLEHGDGVASSADAIAAHVHSRNGSGASHAQEVVLSKQTSGK